jgi:hypothetical protein
MVVMVFGLAASACAGSVSSLPSVAPLHYDPYPVGVQFINVDPVTGCRGQITTARHHCEIRATLWNYSRHAATVRLSVEAYHADERLHHPHANDDEVAIRAGGQWLHRHSYVRAVPFSLPGHSRAVVMIRATVPAGVDFSEGAVGVWLKTDRDHRTGDRFLTMPYVGYPCAGTYEDDESCS